MAGASGSSPRSAGAAPSTSPCLTGWRREPSLTKSASARPERRVARPPDWSLERELWRQGRLRVAGVDEAGRGALAGPVVAAVVLLAPELDYPYRDSKTLTPQRRSELAKRIKQEAHFWQFGVATAREVDGLNVLEATRLAARRALAAAQDIDGLVTDYLACGAGLPEVAVARADSLSYQVAAASVIAKHERDQLMIELEERFPGYGFAQNKGYGVAHHLAALARLGPCPQHRRSFAPVSQARLF